MDDHIVDFPPEADNTQFAATPLMPIHELHEKFREFIDRQVTGELVVGQFDFIIENKLFDGCIRLFLTTDHLSNEFEDFSTAFSLTAPAVLLDVDMEETDRYLQVGGQFDFGLDDSDDQPGILTVWLQQIGQLTDLLDAS